MSVASDRSGRGAEKSGWSGLNICHTHTKNEISEDAHGDEVVLLYNGSTMSLFKD